ncbi:MAG: electron transfer flavoprotein subunit alpha/FixB family protein [Pseudomonadota bacterium]
MNVLILAEHDGRMLKPATRHAITAAQTWQAPIHILVAGHQTASIAQEAAALQGVAQVIRIDAPHLAHPLAEDIAGVIVRLDRDYQVILAPHTAFGRNVLPRAAALLDVAMIADVIAIPGPKTYVRPIYAGNINATVESIDPIQVLTIRTSSFAAAADGGAAAIVTLDAPAGTTLAHWLGEARNVSERPGLAGARVVVSGGRALGSAEQFEAVLGPLAKKLGAALGATRAAVDAGIAPNDIQVGQTGAIVAPELYIAAGVSGAVQHTAGMKDSNIIVAINHDPEAPIFNIADYGLVADLFEAVPALTAALNSCDKP